MQKSVAADSYQAAIRKALQAGDHAGIQTKPKRIASARTAAKRIGISHVSLEKHLRRGVVQAYYQSNCGSFFKSESIPALREALAENRQRNWRHCGTAERPACGFAG